MTTYIVKNILSNVTISWHRKVEIALEKARGMKSIGWHVYDSDGNEWDVDFAGRPVIYRRSEE